MMSNKTVVIAGRAFGKTNKITALTLANWLNAMPRSVLRLACYTYEGLKMNVLPGIIQGWESLGYEEGKHFWVEKEPPSQFKIPKPFRDPKGNPKYKITWWNGAVVLLSSMDRAINNGGEFDAIAFEEVKFMDRKPVKEILLAKRGNDRKFGHLSQHGGVLMVTDRPEVQDPGRWVLDEAKNVTKEVNLKILETAAYLAKLHAQIDEAQREKNDSKMSKLNRDLARFGKYLTELRKHSVNYIEASTLENIHALGIKKIMDYYRDLDPYEYAVSVLNQDPGYIPNGFYSRYDPKTHGYININYSYFDSIDTRDKAAAKRNCLWDNDRINDAPLYIACDHNNAVNNIVCGQIIGKTAYLQAEMYVEDPEYIEALIDKWADYYEAHGSRSVVYGYNQTSINENSQGTPPESETVIRKLRKRGWNVRAEYLGRVPTHKTTHSLWSHTLNDEDPDILGFRMNLKACERLSKVLRATDVIRSGSTFKKDKRSEKKDYKSNKYLVPPPMATHITEAADAWLLLVQREYYNGDIAPLISSFG